MRKTAVFVAALAALTQVAIAAPPGGNGCVADPQFTAAGCQITASPPPVCVGTTVTFSVPIPVDIDTCGDGRQAASGKIRIKITDGWQAWHYGDGTSGSTGQHTYTTCGTFHVTVDFEDAATDSSKDADKTSPTFDLVVGANWSVDAPISCAGIASPPDGTRVSPNTQIAVTCALATDTDLKNCGTPTPTPDTCTYTWSCSGGAFLNQNNHGQTVTWIAPLHRAAYTITVVVDDVATIPSGDCGARDDGALTFHITVYCCDHQHPINFHQTLGEVDTLHPKTLHFLYAWESPTNDPNDLSTCLVGEVVTYPGPAPDPPFVNWAPQNIQNLGTPGQVCWLSDHHWPPANGMDPQHPNPGQYAVYEATQAYAFNCSVCMAPGAYQAMPGSVPEPHPIDRYVEVSNPASPVSYNYRIVKTGVTGIFPAEP